MADDDVWRITRDLYTAQRGQVVGNTVAWDDLPEDDRLALHWAMLRLLILMKEAWQWPSTPS